MTLVGKTTEQCVEKTMEIFFPPASLIFLQSHIWPMLLRNEPVREIHLKISNARKQSIPVLLNCKRGNFLGVDSYFWTFFVSVERNKFEQELLEARKLAESLAQDLTVQKNFIKSITDSIPSLVAYWDTNLRCHFANKPYQDWFGKLPSTIIGTSMQELLGEHQFNIKVPYFKAALAGEIQIFEYNQTKLNGSVCATLVNYLPDIDAQGQVIGFFSLVNDVTAIKTAELELKLAASVFESTVEGIMVSDATGIILSVNPAFTEITGYSAAESIGQSLLLLKSNHHNQEFYATFWHNLRTKGRWEGEIWNRRKNGENFLEWQSTTLIRGSNNEPVRYVSVFNDITEFWRKDGRIRHLAFHDSLTDLPNRSLLMERINQLIVMAERDERNIAIMFLDLDGFKTVNDNLGHDIGDALLVIVAKKLQRQVRQVDTVARLGGDEFVILLDNPASKEDLEHIATHIIETINEPMDLGGNTVSVGVTIGIAEHASGNHSSVQLVKNADIAMYIAKKTGKNNYQFFNQTMSTPIGDRHSEQNF
jgi:diguanylate cyclase (GGDEF)-like protein/PAS domain S-box-containing protein